MPQAAGDGLEGPLGEGESPGALMRLGPASSEQMADDAERNLAFSIAQCSLLSILEREPGHSSKEHSVENVHEAGGGVALHLCATTREI
jgi:hypothetical protein